MNPYKKETFGLERQKFLKFLSIYAQKIKILVKKKNRK